MQASRRSQEGTQPQGGWAACKPVRALSLEPGHAGTLILDLQPQKPWENVPLSVGFCYSSRSTEIKTQCGSSPPSKEFCSQDVGWPHMWQTSCTPRLPPYVCYKMWPGLVILVPIKKDMNEDRGGPACTLGAAPTPLAMWEGWFRWAPDLTGRVCIPWPRDRWGHTTEAKLAS